MLLAFVDPAIAEVAGFLGASRGVVFGIVQNNLLAAQEARLMDLRSDLEGEVGGGVADLQAHGRNWGSGGSVRRSGQDCLRCLPCRRPAVVGPWCRGSG